MATLRNTAISLLRLAGWTTIAAALRHHQHHPDKSITLLTSQVKHDNDGTLASTLTSTLGASAAITTRMRDLSCGRSWWRSGPARGGHGSGLRVYSAFGRALTTRTALGTL